MNTLNNLDSTFQRLSTLGEGTYGIVYEALHIPSGTKIALKKIRTLYTHDHDITGISTTALREVILLKEINHPNIVKLIHVAHVDAQLWICFELCDLDLRQYLKQKINKKNQQLEKQQYFLPIEQCKSLAKQLLEGIAHCHSRRIIHRDLKPQNILLNKNGTLLKIADFGLARTFTTPAEQNTHEVVTLWYRAPELLLGDDHYTSALDVWSAGCIIAEIVTGRPLFHGDSEIGTLFRIFQILGTPVDSNKLSLDNFWEGVSNLQYYQSLFPKWKRDPKGLENALAVNDALLIDFLYKILQYPAKKRLTAIEALHHPWLLT